MTYSAFCLCRDRLKRKAPPVVMVEDFPIEEITQDEKGREIVKRDGPTRLIWFLENIDALPPIALTDTYYCKDGHHRIAAREFAGYSTVTTTVRFL